MAESRLAIELVSIDRVFLSPSNPRHNEEAVPHVAASLRRFGFQQPIVAKRDGEVIAGNTRLKAAKSLGITEVPVVWFDGTDLDATAYQIADNKTHEFSTWDDGALAKLLEELRAEDALEGVGFNDGEIDQLLAQLEAANGAAVDDPGPQEPPAVATSRLGDLWLLGKHRLLCGDSTKPDDLARLMQGDKSALFSTDPPYCVDYTGNDRPIHNGKASGKDWSHVYREVDIKDLGAFMDGVFAACLPHAIDSAPIYVWHAHVQQPTIAAAFERHGLLLHQVIVWVKPAATFGHCFYRWKHEPCAFGWKRGHRPEHGHGALETVWELDWDGKARVTTFHPTSKPTRVFEIPMEQHTKPGDIVLEPFSGSGSQLIAAEKLSRRCRAIELSPTFVDGAIDRWQQATGQQARSTAPRRPSTTCARRARRAEPCPSASPSSRSSTTPASVLVAPTRPSRITSAPRSAASPSSRSARTGRADSSAPSARRASAASRRSSSRSRR
ncbi:MAG: DNA methylase [Planctomycetota bacterium]|nr:MAG: DNA methylase [Planctomycetota bacterium]